MLRCSKNLASLVIKKAVRVLHAGGIIAYPTEAVYGLGCDPQDQMAVYDLLAIKHRPLEKGLILIASEFKQLSPFIKPVSAQVMAKIQESWPGPHTWILPADENAPDWLTGNRDSIAVRVTRHPVAHRLCQQFGAAIVSTSANHHGKPALLTSLKVRIHFANQVDFIVPGSVGPELKPSIIQDAISGEIIRPN